MRRYTTSLTWRLRMRMASFLVRPRRRASSARGSSRGSARTHGRPSRRTPAARACALAGTLVAAGYVGLLPIELHFPEAGSLKGKRRFVRSAKAQLVNRFGASVAEVAHHDLWQRAGLTVAGVAREAHEAERLLDEAERYLHGQEFEAVPDRSIDLIIVNSVVQYLSKNQVVACLAQWHRKLSASGRLVV